MEETGAVWIPLLRGMHTRRMGIRHGSTTDTNTTPVDRKRSVMKWFREFWAALNAPSSGVTKVPADLLGSFTPQATQVLALARTEAIGLQHGFIGTEHVLLGLLGDETGIVSRVLGRSGVDCLKARETVRKQIGAAPTTARPGRVANLPYTPRVKKILALAAKHARTLQHDHVGTEHILLGLVTEVDHVASRVLQGLGVDPQTAHRAVLSELGVDDGPLWPFEGEAAPASQEVIEAEREAISRTLPTPTRELTRSIDPRRRYDVYCVETDQRVVVYRSMRFLGRRELGEGDSGDPMNQFLELEPLNGQSVFVPLLRILKFGSPGAVIDGEVVPPGGAGAS